MATQKDLNATYIVIGARMFVYRMTHYEKATNRAQLTLYKNPADFRSGKTLKQITVDEWLWLFIASHVVKITLSLLSGVPLSIVSGNADTRITVSLRNRTFSQIITQISVETNAKIVRM